MKLPLPERLAELAEIFRTKAPQPKDFEPFSACKAKLAKYAKMGAMTVVQSGAQTGVTMAAGAATMSVGVGMVSIAIFPLGAALGPWLAAVAIASKAESIFALHDLRASARSKGVYPCSCGNCVANLTYVIDRKENNVGIMAAGVFTAGLAIIADRLNSVRKSFQKGRPKEKICVSLIEGARGGCLCAIAGIMMICDDKDATIDAIAVIWSTDGAARLKSKW